MDKRVYEFIHSKTGDPIVERKNCAITGQPFAVFQSDLDFYQQISPTFGGKKYLIPAPTLCPEERQRRRLAIRHETCLYSRECDLTGKKLVTAYSPDKPYKVYDHTAYRTDKWNPSAFFIRYDPSKKFFEQFDTLLHQVPRISLLTDLRNENSLYVDQANLVRNCYMIWAAGFDEFCYYSYRVRHSNYVVDSSFVTKVEHSYECVECDGCYNCKYAVKCNDCADSSFLYNCKNCKNCFFCENLANAQYYFFGKQYSKEEYEVMIQQYNLGSYTTVIQLKNKFDELVKEAIHKAIDNVGSDRCFGHLAHRSKNVVRAFSCRDMEDSKYCFLYAEAKKCMDVDYR